MTLDVGEAADLDVVYADCGVAGTYRHGGSHSSDKGEYSESAAFSGTAVTLIRNAKREDTLKLSGLLVEGNRVWNVRAGELLEAPAADDELVVGSDTWQLSGWELDGSELEYELHCREVS